MKTVFRYLLAGCSLALLAAIAVAQTDFAGH